MSVSVYISTMQKIIFYMQVTGLCFGTVRYIEHYPANAKHLYNICATSAQRLRRWSNVVQMLYKCVVLTGY